MMREIKFRAWNKDNDEMVYSFDYPYHWNIGDLGLELLESDGTDYIQQEAVFMQFTGLLDKKGTEIYEGDVVKGTAIQIEGGFDYFGEVEFITQNATYGLKVTEPLRNGVAGVWSIDQLRTRISLDHITGEVIGNIYENPELLEAEQWP